MKTQNSTHLPDPIHTTPEGQPPADLMAPPPENIIPDEIPRRDGPGGEGNVRQAGALRD